MICPTGYGTKKSKRFDAILALKRVTIALQNAYVIGLTHAQLEFLVANLRDISDNNTFLI